MDGWTCPRCGRLFATRGQGPDRATGPREEEYFATGPSHERAAVGFSLRRRATHRAITRNVEQYGARYWHAAGT